MGEVATECISERVKGWTAKASHDKPTMSYI
jgi:hypothetical protein